MELFTIILWGYENSRAIFTFLKILAIVGHRNGSFLKPVSYLKDLYSGRSFFIVGTRAEDNFAPLEKIPYPILSMAKVFINHHLSAKWFSTRSRSLCA